MNRILSIIMICILIVLSFTGCGSTNSNSSPSDVSGTSSAENLNDTSLTGRPKEIAEADHSASEKLYEAIKGTTVRVPITTDPNASHQAKKKAFEKKFDCTVVYEQYDWREWEATLARLVASGDTPDVAGISSDNFITYVTQNLIVPLDQYILTDDNVWNLDLMESYKWKGKYYAGASGPDMVVIVYNKTMFENAGQKEPIEYYNEGTWNFETLRKVAKAMTKTGANGQTEVYGYYSGIRELGVLANGGSFVKATEDGNLVITADKPNELAGIQLIQDLMNDGSYAWAVPGDSQNFVKGKIAMIADRSWVVLDSLRPYETMKDELAVCPFPTGPDADTEIAPAVCNATGVLASAKNPLGGAAWIWFSNYYDNVEQNSPESLATRRVWLSAENEALMDGWSSKMKIQTTFCAGIGEWWTKTMPFWEDIMYNNVSPATAVKKYRSEMQYEIDQVLKAK